VVVFVEQYLHLQGAAVVLRMRILVLGVLVLRVLLLVLVPKL
jgi:hypothetical protein